MSPKLKPLKDQTIVITGASSGIGLATAQAAAKRGANVVLVARNEAVMDRIAQEINGKGGHAIVVAADVADAVVTVQDDLDRGVVRVGEPIALAAIASVHADDGDAEATVAAAAQAVIAADLGDPGSQELVDDAEGFELSWYANQEIAHLLDSF